MHQNLIDDEHLANAEAQDNSQQADSEQRDRHRLVDSDDQAVGFEANQYGSFAANNEISESNDKQDRVLDELNAFKASDNTNLKQQEQNIQAQKHSDKDERVNKQNMQQQPKTGTDKDQTQSQER